MKSKQKFTVVIERYEEVTYVASVSGAARVPHAGENARYADEAGQGSHRASAYEDVIRLMILLSYRIQQFLLTTPAPHRVATEFQDMSG